MEIGKMPVEILNKYVLEPINNSENKRKEIILRPSTGEDCSVIDLGGELCVISTDPITGAKKNLGYIAVHINCNDIAASGAEPVAIVLTVLLPIGSTEEMFGDIMSGAHKAASELGIEIAGGHTEVTSSVNEPVISATVIGKSVGGTFISSAGAVCGQSVVMTKWAGLEGTAIITNDYEYELKSILTEEEMENAKGLNAYLSVVKEGAIAKKFGATCMHDATEGGIFGALWEIAECSGKGINIFLDKILIKSETKKICKHLNLNPYKLISSGVMIIAAHGGEALARKLNEHGIEAAVIGEITPAGKYYFDSQGNKYELTPPQSDEIYHVKF